MGQVRTLLARKWPLLVGAIAAAIAAWLISSSLPGPAISLILPDDTTFKVTKPGGYTLWLEAVASTHRNSDLLIFSNTLPPGVTIAITKPDGTRIPMQTEWPPSKSDNTAETIQQAISNIRFESAGSYRIAVEGLHEKRVLRLDPSDRRGFIPKIFIVIALPMVFLGWALLSFYRRQRTTVDAIPPIQR